MVRVVFKTTLLIRVMMMMMIKGGWGEEVEDNDDGISRTDSQNNSSILSLPHRDSVGKVMLQAV